MGKIYCIMGKSSSGKDSIYKMLLEDEQLSLAKIIPYTTRPMREGECDGVEYYFCSEERLAELERAGRIIELRAYDTVCGIWKYFTVNDHQICKEERDCLMITTLAAYRKLDAYFGDGRVVPVYVEVEDGERLQRALDRERSEKLPNYEELCRRFLADARDFSEEELKAAGIKRRFVNRKLIETVQNIKNFMLE